MTVDRREFLMSAAAVSVAPWPAPRSGPGESPIRTAEALGVGLRADFPHASSRTYLNSAAQHPLGLPMLRAMEQHLHFNVYGPGEGRQYFSAEDKQTLKEEYGALINAKAEEIAFVASTSDGENVVVAGMDLPRRGGNVVVDDLHFTTSLFMYKMLEEKGLELRVVKSRDGEVPIDAMDEAIDRDTRLVSMALVSNVNGFMQDVAAVSEIAHERGALVYADIIQAVGGVPIDVEAMGIDCAAASTYKWLMGERGFGLLYVREDLQGTAIPTTRWGHRQLKRFDRRELTWERLPGAARYEAGNIAEPLAAAVLAGIRYIDGLGVDNIVRHAQGLIGRLQAELPSLGYRSLTPGGTGTPIIAFHVPDPDDLIRRMEEANVLISIYPPEQRMRVSVSVFNTEQDIDRLIKALT